MDDAARLRESFSLMQGYQVFGSLTLLASRSLIIIAPVFGLLGGSEVPDGQEVYLP